MGDAYIKIAGTWTKANNVYTKRGDVWTPVKEVWTKRSGVWTQSYAIDTVPCSPPLLTLQLAGGNRWIRVGVRLPDTTHQTDLRRIRVLVSDVDYPTAWNGSGAISGADNNYPNESWSDYWYNNQHPTPPSSHPSSAIEVAKQYPRNPTSTTNLKGGKHYYFTAWSEDINNNWSVGVAHKIWMPKDGATQTNLRAKELYADPISGGSTNSTNTYTSGVISAKNSPRSNAFFFYGDQFVSNVGHEGTISGIGSKAIRLSRAADDPGQPQANVKLGWHGQSTPGNIATSALNEITTLGTLGKGEAKWFSLPDTWDNNWNTSIRGVGIAAGTLAADDIVLNELSRDSRQGEINLNWTEQL